ncbi:DeoR/GlpR family DNA-binding transcription regulator [Marasmitruncus massiliensis]|uniref:DeoR/GlpR family DNA-binding transcription regulator n=1 Tax=Marasmitruncus massiliensis TaxID=1944642 RepID=UPI000C7C888D|nr:DeoR/GlpR family DNA-binding transcription regulator [Marasmitruncus massiliensis]
MRAVRLKQIEQYISEREFVTINELCEYFAVHKNTMRADINELAERGIVEKRYGGVSYKSYYLPTSYDERTALNVESKEIIGRLAAPLLDDDDVVYVDSGTTAPMLFREPAQLPKRLTVITNSLSVINWCFQNSDYNIFALPGKGDRQLNSFASLETIESVRAYNIQKAFLGIRGISRNGDLSSASPVDAKLKTTILEISQQCILMAGAEKLNNPAMLNFARMDAMDMWVCDQATNAVKQLAERMHVQLISPAIAGKI